ncbi:ribosomal protein L13 [Russula earlei]|uniref:Ribosomal protein L13 n=2 Tax=Russula earlei TaxID=71964 RepID=A0ACC0TU35_9AGAM|nr:ribosomal protein L13 [Russula earlei]KAI9510576.1 ribosomal protein L13 [Russula earlei]
MGKHKSIYGPSVDCGDYVVVTNAGHINATGRKADQILYRKHTRYPGGLKEIKYKEMMDKKYIILLSRFGITVIRKVSGMLPKNKLRERRLERLRIFDGPDMSIFQKNILRR